MPTDPLGLLGQVLLGRYRVDRAIAQGGMGVVYQGHDQRLRRNVCIKVFHQLSDSELVRRTSYEHFVQEAFALSQLSHPHTLRIFDFGHLEDESRAPFQVSELLEGGTLARLVRREGPRTPEEALALLTPVAGALSEAHARGIVHRDIKPSNIFLVVLGQERVAKLGDFGIALMPPGLLPSETTFDSLKANMRLYSPGWAAPEQLRGERPAPATDVFALGLVTAFVLAGEPLFSTDDDAFDRERADSDGHVARRLLELALPGPIAEVIQTACRAAPFERYDTVDLFIAALRDAVAACASEARVARHAPAVGDENEAPSVITSSLLLPAHAASSPPPPSEESPSAPLAMRALLQRALTQQAVRHVIACEGPRVESVSGRSLTRMVLSANDQLDIGGEGGPIAGGARVRVTFLPSVGPLPRVNIKGLNCFVARLGKRPAAAVDVDADSELELLAPDRTPFERLRCLLGRPSHDADVVYELSGCTLAVTGALHGALLLDLGPGRELVLLHRGTTRACLGGHS